ncbi:rho-associated protein kinase 2-like [Dendronephthya gigantea]|uniref:rho-associated protein kinase 2-like n=1 Tax=Dendronephthya gigantea TaxID=151771 RepID=UPI00106BF8EF|nr:rho-associated protein kinase 2-like [Dendronephthya gigantea]
MASINQSESSTQPTINNQLVVEGSKIKWNGSFEDLKAFTELRLGLGGNWTSPGGSTKLFSSDEITIKYSKKSLVLSFEGEASLKIKDLVKDIYLTNKAASEHIADGEPLTETRETVESDSELLESQTGGEAIAKHQSSKIGNLHFISESTDSNLHTNSRDCNLNTDKIQLNDQNYTSNLNSTNFNKNPKEVYEIESKLEKYTQSVTQKLEALADEISTIKETKENKAYAILVLEDVVNELRKEKLQLNRENNELKEKNRNLFQSLSEARAKVLDLQEEKSSLMTSLKLVQREKVLPAERERIKELETENDSLRAAARSLQEDLNDGSKTQKRDYTKVKSSSKDTSESVFESKNRYEVLSISDQEDDANDSVSKVSLDKTLETGHRNENTNTTYKGTKSKRNILLIGDSMIKDINPHKISKSSVRKRAGKRAEEIANEFQKAHVHSSPTDVIIHAGTNNLIQNSSKECCDNIKHLSSTVQNKFKDARIAISGLISRGDIDVATKIHETNKLLYNLCKKKGYTFIANKNIDESCLNGSKLHLNTKGSALLAVHFIKFLRRLSHPTVEDFPKELHHLGELLRMIIPQTPRKRIHR